MTNRANIQDRIQMAEMRFKNAWTRSANIKAANELTRLRKLQRRMIALETL